MASSEVVQVYVGNWTSKGLLQFNSASWRWNVFKKHKPVQFHTCPTSEGTTTDWESSQTWQNIHHLLVATLRRVFLGAKCINLEKQLQLCLPFGGWESRFRLKLFRIPCVLRWRVRMLVNTAHTQSRRFLPGATETEPDQAAAHALW